MKRAIALIFLMGFAIICLLQELDIIGSINAGLNPKKFKKIDISKKKIFIPYHGRHFFKKIKGYKPAFDGKVFKITYILTISAYIYHSLSFVFLILFGIFLNDLTLMLFLGWELLFGCVLAIIQAFTVRSFKKRLKEEGPDFKI